MTNPVMKLRGVTVAQPGVTISPLYPSIDAQGFIQRESADGSAQALVGGGLIVKEIVGGNAIDIAKVTGVTTEILVTQSRVAVAVKEWNKGGRSWGVGLGATSALIENTVQKRREARERGDSMLVGHVRYNWLKEVGFQRPRSARNDNLVLACVDGYRDNRLLMFIMGIPKGLDGVQLADEVSALAAQYWLGRATSSLSDEQTQELATLRDRTVAPLALTPGRKGAMRAIPVYQKVHESTAAGYGGGG